MRWANLGGGFEEEVDALVEEVAARDAGDAGGVGAGAGGRGGAERLDCRGTGQADGADDGGVGLEGRAAVRGAEAGHEPAQAAADVLRREGPHGVHLLRRLVDGVHAVKVAWRNAERSYALPRRPSNDHRRLMESRAGAAICLYTVPIHR